ncbi:MAG: recombinase family protein [Planctomycetes bacterium]|nr:recombinase family protein [Planctomycetota bacterium]
MTVEYPAPIRDEHRARKAVVYVRQSSPSQVRISGESARLQRDLQQRAIAIGWSQPLVIDEDLGVSAAGYAERPGFQRLLSMVAMREVGIVLCIDASRLSRNSKDWAHLFELCAYFGTLIADLDQVYDLTAPNDRLVMGIKGTMSELELTILRRRLQGGLESKAARGELRINLPAGYVYDGDDIVMDPDQRVQAAIRLMFDQFDRSSSIRQLAMWYRDQDIAFLSSPCVARRPPNGRSRPRKRCASCSSIRSMQVATSTDGGPRWWTSSTGGSSSARPSPARSTRARSVFTIIMPPTSHGTDCWRTCGRSARIMSGGPCSKVPGRT